MNKEQEIASEIQLIKHFIQGIKDRLEDRKISTVEDEVEETYNIGDRFKEASGSIYMLAVCGPNTVVLVDEKTGRKASSNLPVVVEDVSRITIDEFNKITPSSWNWNKIQSNMIQTRRFIAILKYKVLNQPTSNVVVITASDEQTARNIINEKYNNNIVQLTEIKSIREINKE